MEPDVIRMYSSSPPPLEDGGEEEDEMFGDFGTYSGVPGSISFTEFDTPTTYNQTQALNATSPPELLASRGLMGVNGARGRHIQRSRPNGIIPGNHQSGSLSERTDRKKANCSAADELADELADANGQSAAVLTNGFDVQGSPSSHNSVHYHVEGRSAEDRSAEDRSAEDRSAEDRSAVDRSAVDRSAEDRSAEDTSAEDRSAVPVSSRVGEFADFASFSGIAGCCSQTPSEDVDTDARPEDAVRDATPEDAVRDATPEDAVRDATPEDAVRDATPEDAVRDATPEDAVRDATPEDAVRDATPEDAVRDATPEDAVRDATPEDAVRDATPEDAVRDATPEDAVRDATPEDAVRDATPEDSVRDTNSTGPGSCSTDAGSQRVVAQELCTNASLVVNGADVALWDEDDLSPEAAADSEVGHSDEKGSGNETETETETSFGRPLSTDALEEYGDISTTGSAPSPPLQGEPSTPADHSQLAEDEEEEEDFGDFGDAGDFGGQGFADEFGDFNSPKLLSRGGEDQDGGKFAEFPVSDSFGNFSSAVEEEDTGWSAFEDQVEEGESWAEFSTEQIAAPPPERRDDEEEEEEEEEEVEEWHESEAPAGNHQTCRTDVHTVALLLRLQKVFESSFPLNASANDASSNDDVVSLKNLLEPREDTAPPGGEEGTRRSPDRRVPGVWTQLQDVNEALGLRYQWGGSYCNKTLLCCLGIDTRNILFTGQRKQPVIVPMYAASLGMLEPTKEPVKPVSAAEMIAAIAQAPPPDQTSCSSDSAQQEALPPVQFDWSSSGLINPLDGSSLLNLDFFGPDDEFSCCSSLPGVDPELYELTTSKPDSSSSRVADAFARLMLTMEKTSTSTRKPRKEENLSEEASKVMAALPDLSFMHAKVLMFPATLTPLGSRNAAD